MSDVTLAIGIFALCIYGLFRLVKFILVKCKKNMSSFLLFGIVDIFGGLVVLGLSLWDFLTPGGDLNGMLGTLALLIFEPVVIVMLIGDIVICKLKKKKQHVIEE